MLTGTNPHGKCLYVLRELYCVYLLLCSLQANDCIAIDVKGVILCGCIAIGAKGVILLCVYGAVYW